MFGFDNIKPIYVVGGIVAVLVVLNILGVV